MSPLQRKNQNIKIVVKELQSIKNPDLLSRVVFRDFQYLSKEEGLEHNIIELLRLFTDDKFIGLFAFNQKNNKLIAYLAGEVKHLNDGRVVYYISYMFVDAKYRDKKIGSRLLQMMIRRCQELGYSFLVLTCDTTDPKLTTFYKKHGFNYDPVLQSGTKHDVFSLFL